MGSIRSAVVDAPREQKPLGSFASASDRAWCRKLHRRYDTTYYFPTKWLPANLRRRVHALHAFVRVPDEWVDNPAKKSISQKAAGLQGYRSEFLRGMDGVVPRHSVLRAFCDVVHEVSMPLDEPLRFLEAMDRDLSVDRYVTYFELRTYMRGSAGSVGLMVCHLLGVELDSKTEQCASLLGEAVQLTDILRNLGEDVRRCRIYIPTEDIRRFPGSEDGIVREEVTRQYVNLMRFEIARARKLFAEVDAGTDQLPRRPRLAMKMASILYARILDRIEAKHFDVFSKRIRISFFEKLVVAARVLLGLA